MEGTPQDREGTPARRTRPQGACALRQEVNPYPTPTLRKCRCGGSVLYIYLNSIQVRQIHGQILSSYLFCNPTIVLLELQVATAHVGRTASRPVRGRVCPCPCPMSLQAAYQKPAHGAVNPGNRRYRATQSRIQPSDTPATVEGCPVPKSTANRRTTAEVRTENKCPIANRNFCNVNTELHVYIVCNFSRKQALCPLPATVLGTIGH